MNEWDLGLNDGGDDDDDDATSSPSPPPQVRRPEDYGAMWRELEADSEHARTMHELTRDTVHAYNDPAWALAANLRTAVEVAEKSYPDCPDSRYAYIKWHALKSPEWVDTPLPEEG